MDLSSFETAIKSRFLKEWGLGHIDPHDILALWWVFSQLTDEDIDAAKQSLTKPPDGGVDAVLVDPEMATVHLVQSKFRDSNKVEKEGDFNRLTQWASRLTGSEEDFESAIHGLSAVTKARLRAARSAIAAGFTAHFEFVSTGRITAGAAARQPAGFRFVGGKQLLSLFDDYASGVRPIASLSMEVAAANAELSDASGVGLGIFMVPGSEIRRLTVAYPSRLFARNIRGFLGEKSPVNAAIIRTIRDDPERFRFLNNGLTVVCDRSVVTTESGKRTLTLDNPQVVNGQQTSRSLAKVLKKEAANVEVTVRVVTISRGSVDGPTYDHLVREIVEATNRQSAIPVAELRSNDKSQVDIQRAMLRLGYYYARKAGGYGEYLLKAGGNPILLRRLMVDAVAGCLEESLAHRESKPRLYEDPYYDQIFDASQVKRNIVAWYLWKGVLTGINKSSKGPSRDQGKWLALYAMWQWVWVDGHVDPDQFIEKARAASVASVHSAILADLVQAVAKSIDAYYAAAKKVDKAIADPVRYFKTKSLHPAYVAYLTSEQGQSHKNRIESKVRDLLEASAA